MNKMIDGFEQVKLRFITAQGWEKLSCMKMISRIKS